MDLEKRVAAIEQKLGISMDSASTNISPTIIPSTDTTSTIVSPTITPTSTNVTPTIIPAIPTSTNVTPTIIPAIPTSTNVAPTVVPSIVSSTNTSTVPGSTTISINGYNGTLDDLKKNINSKIGSISNVSHKGRYKDRVAELNTLLRILNKATTVQEIQSAIGTKLKFKNNILTAGKSKRRGRKTKKSNKSKRR
jgi:hypothetical protein